MDIDLPREDDPRRVEVRRWFEEHPEPSPADLVEAGFVVPHWPRPWGLDAEPELQLIIDDELRRAGVSRPMNPIGIGHCGPVLVVHGTDEQQERYLMPMLRGEELWCQLFSEPEAGSDLANLSTRAVRDGDVFVVNGQKIWTSLAQVAKFGILIARTDTDTSKYTGISYFIIPMDLPGIEIRPLRNMVGGYGDAGFCEVFFTDVHVPAENLIGTLNGGWAMAKETLANERVSLSREGLQWGYGPTVRDLVELAPEPRRRRRADAPAAGGRLHRRRDPPLPPAPADLGRGQQEARARRLAAQGPQGPARQGRVRAGQGHDGRGGMLGVENDPEWEAWARGFLFSPALTVGGGTSEVLRNVIAERILGLPHDTDVEAGLTWTEGRARLREVHAGRHGESA